MDIKVKIGLADGRILLEQPIPAVQPEARVVSPENITNLGRLLFKRVGHCIYCSSRDGLSREHIIPFGLCGQISSRTNYPVLQKASCEKCRAITQVFENKILRGPMWAVRVLQQMKSYSRHVNAPTTERLTIKHSNGTDEIVELPLDEYPVLLTLPILAPPRRMRNVTGDGIDCLGWHTILFGTPPETLKSRFAGKTIELRTEQLDLVAFLKLIAKIGYCVAYAEDKLTMIAGPSPVVKSILGETDDIGQWVGVVDQDIKKYPGVQHRIAIRDDFEHKLLVADVQLFADSGAPIYCVIIGSLR